MLLGDSITFADFLPEEQTFVRLVESLAAKTNRPLETINAGIGGASLENEYALLVETGLSLKPDVIVLNSYLNDIHESPGVRPVQVPGILKKSLLAQHFFAQLSRTRRLERHGFDDGNVSHQKKKWKNWFRSARELYPMADGDITQSREAFNKEILLQFGNWGNVWVREPWEHMQPLFREFSRLSVVHDFLWLVVCFPVVHQVTSHELRNFPQQRLSEICNSLDTPFLDLLPPFREAFSKSDQSLFFDDCHPNVAANRMIAEQILKFIHSNYRGKG